MVEDVPELPIVSPSARMSGPLMDYLARRLRTAAESEVERFGLRARHVIAMTLLRDFGERPQADLAEMLQLDPSNVVGLLNELEAAGLAERRRSTQDRRRHTVVLTASGADRLAAIEEALVAVEHTVLRALDDDQLATLNALLHTAIGEVAVDCATDPGADPTAARR